MTSGISNLRIVTIDCPYDSWNDPRTQELFAKMVGLRLEGFKAAYGYGILPLDASDFVANQQLICVDKGGHLFPVLGQKSVTLSRAAKHRLTFPGISFCQMSAAPIHERIVRRIVADAEKSGREISYEGGWTIDPNARKDKEFSTLLRRIYAGMFCLYHRDYQVHEAVGCAVVRFKAHEHFHGFGYKPVADDEGKELPNIVTYFSGEPVQLIHMAELSEKALREANEFYFMWKNRLKLDSPEAVQEVLKKIA